MSQSETVSEVDLDELFNTLDTKTVKDFKRVIQGFATAYEGVAPQANKGFHYLNPFLSTSRRVFGELSRDTPAFESLIVDTSKLSGLLAARSQDLTDLVSNTNLALGAIASQRSALTEAINRLPGFMRQANTTFVNLRAALDDVDPLVKASLPVADRLRPFFSEFRAAAADAVPTIRDLDAIVRRPGRANDLIELTRAQVPLARAGVGSGAPDCGSNPTTDYNSAADDNFNQGGLGESNCALRNSLPALAQLRAYTPELVGWFNDFGPSSGNNDASGGLGRIATTFNAFSPSITGIVDLLGLPLDASDVVQGIGADSLNVGNDARCPGASSAIPATARPPSPTAARSTATRRRPRSGPSRSVPLLARVLGRLRHEA